MILFPVLWQRGQSASSWDLLNGRINSNLFLQVLQTYSYTGMTHLSTLSLNVSFHLRQRSFYLGASEEASISIFKKAFLFPIQQFFPVSAPRECPSPYKSNSAAGPSTLWLYPGYPGSPERRWSYVDRISPAAHHQLR
jgi:hypothetical protein